MPVLIVYLVFFFYSVGYNIFGTLASEIMLSKSLAIDEAGLMQSFLQVGAVSGILFSTFLSKRFTSKQVLMFGMSIASFALILFFFNPIWSLILLFYAIFGFGGFFLDSGSNAYLSDYFKDKRGKYIPLLHFTYSLGALSCGYLVLPFKNENWFKGYGFVGIIIFCFLILALFSQTKSKNGLLFNVISENKTAKENNRDKIKEREVSHSVRALTSKEILSDRYFLLYCLALMLYMTSQQTCSNWFPLYMEEKFVSYRFNETIASATTLCFWTGIAIMRFVSGFIIDKGFSPLKMCIVGMGASGIFQGLSLCANNTIIAFILILFCGLFAGATIPCFIVEVTGWYPHNTAFVSFFYLFCGSVGRLIIPYLVTVVAATVGLRSSLAYSTGLLFLGSLISLFVYAKKYKD